MSFSSRFNKPFLALVFGASMVLSLPLNAAALGFWSSDDWTLLDAEDNVGTDGYVGPGAGGQAFDAEYLYWKQDGYLLSIGLQTGFDILSGQQDFAGDTYYAGDLALAFNGGSYTHAIDFGLVTRDSDGVNVGLGGGDQDAAGLYSVSAWNNNITYTISSPFGMDEGAYVSAITTTSGMGGDSYFRTATIDLSTLGFNITSFSAHWTMSCGNDEVEGSANVPEPSALLLMAGGLLGLFGGSARRRMS